MNSLGDPHATRAAAPATLPPLVLELLPGGEPVAREAALPMLTLST